MCGIFMELAAKELRCWPVLRLGRLFKKLTQICSHRFAVSLLRLMDDPARHLAWVGGRGTGATADVRATGHSAGP